MRWLVVSLVLLTLILVPFFLFEDFFNTLAARILAGDVSPWSAGFAIVALLSSDVVLPIPSSLVSAAAGVLLGFWRGALVVWLGMTASCLIGYTLGSRAASTARRFVGEDGLARAAGVFARYGDLAIVLCRPVPVLAEASVIFAGLAHASFARFFTTCVWANLGVALSYAAIGAFSMRMDSFLAAFLGAIAFPGLAALAARVWLRSRVPAPP